MNKITAGDILVSKWGYDQTNVDFFVVTKRTPKMVILQKLGTHKIATGSMTGKAAPSFGGDPGEPLRRKVYEFGGEERVAINESARAAKWNQQSQWFSEYA